MSHVEKRRRVGATGTTTYWRARYRAPDGREHSRSFRRRTDAERFLAEVTVDLGRGAWVDPAGGRVLFDDWVVRWWPTTTDLRPSSRARDESYMRVHVLPRFSRMPLAALQRADIQAWVSDLSASGLAPATVHKAYQVLRKALTAAVDDGLLAGSPCERVRLPRIEREEMRFLVPDEVQRLADVIDPRYRALVLLGAYGGLRRGELFGLRRSRVDLLRGRVDIAEVLLEVRGELTMGPPKTRASRRSVPLPRRVVDELQEHLERYTAPTTDAHVFTAPHGGPVRPPGWRARVWVPAVEAAGLAPLRLHDLRHTAVAFWIAAGGHAREVQALAGHTSSVVVLDRYGHLLPGTEDRLTETLDAMARRAQADRSNGTVTPFSRRGATG